MRNTIQVEVPNPAELVRRLRTSMQPQLRRLSLLATLLQLRRCHLTRLGLMQSPLTVTFMLNQMSLGIYLSRYVSGGMCQTKSNDVHEDDKKIALRQPLAARLEHERLKEVTRRSSASVARPARSLKW